MLPPPETSLDVYFFKFISFLKMFWWKMTQHAVMISDLCELMCSSTVPVPLLYRARAICQILLLRAHARGCWCHQQHQRTHAQCVCVCGGIASRCWIITLPSRTQGQPGDAPSRTSSVAAEHAR